MTPDELERWLDDPARRPLIMGVLNVTPDSFSDGGRFATPEQAEARARAMIDDGADWIDIGGESTRPGSDRVAPAEQVRRVVPVIESLRGHDFILSVDTSSAHVAEAALAAGACVINDVTAATADAAMLDVMRRAAAVVLMHMLAEPKTMQRHPQYADVLADVERYLLRRAAALEDGGVSRRRLLIDPGIGFGKTSRHNLQLLAALPRLASHGYPVLVGASRKQFIGRVTGEPVPERRLFGTAAVVAWSLANGAAVVRVHDVREMRQVLQMIEAIRRLESVGE